MTTTNALRLSLLSTALLATACAATGPAPRAADDESGLYVKAYGGAGILEDDTIELTGAGASNASGDGSFDAGFLAGAAVGYDFTKNWAVELDYTYRTNDVDEFTAGGATVADGGDYASTALMLNAYYTFAPDWKVKPYVGLGFGYATEIDIDLEGGSLGGSQSYSGSSPAAQFMVGGTTRLTDSLRAYVEGRFFRAFDPEMDGEEGAAGTVESEYGHWGLLFGVNYAF